MVELQKVTKIFGVLAKSGTNGVFATAAKISYISVKGYGMAIALPRDGDGPELARVKRRMSDSDGVLIGVVTLTLFSILECSKWSSGKPIGWQFRLESSPRTQSRK